MFYKIWVNLKICTSKKKLEKRTRRNQIKKLEQHFLLYNFCQGK